MTNQNFFKKIQLFNFALSSVNKNGKLYFEDKNNPGSAMSSLYKRHLVKKKYSFTMRLSSIKEVTYGSFAIGLKKSVGMYDLA